MAEPAHSFDDSEAYERFMGRWSRAAGIMFLDWLAAPAQARWLDVGCGTGAFTGLIVGMCSPASVSAIDPAAAQIEHASRGPLAARASFRTGDAQALPYAANTFDLVASALVLNFVPDRLQALSEMRRVACPNGVVAGYVWDFESERSPSWPLRLGMRKLGLDVPDVPGTRESGLGALRSAFERAGLEDNSTTFFDVSVAYRDFDDFWQAQTPSYSPTSKMIAAMTEADRGRLVDAVRAGLPLRAGGTVEYAARANAIKGRVPAEAGPAS